MSFYSVGASFFNASLLRAWGNFSGYCIGRQHTDGDSHKPEYSLGTFLSMFS